MRAEGLETHLSESRHMRFPTIRYAAPPGQNPECLSYPTERDSLNLGSQFVVVHEISVIVFNWRASMFSRLNRIIGSRVVINTTRSKYDNKAISRDSLVLDIARQSIAELGQKTKVVHGWAAIGRQSRTAQNGPRADDEESVFSTENDDGMDAHRKVERTKYPR